MFINFRHLVFATVIIGAFSQGPEKDTRLRWMLMRACEKQNGCQPIERFGIGRSQKTGQTLKKTLMLYKLRNRSKDYR